MTLCYVCGSTHLDVDCGIKVYRTLFWSRVSKSAEGPFSVVWIDIDELFSIIIIIQLYIYFTVSYEFPCIYLGAIIDFQRKQYFQKVVGTIFTLLSFFLCFCFRVSYL